MTAMASDVRPWKRLRPNEGEFKNYDVFISHRGLDTKTGFVGFLYDGLQCAGLRPFLDCVSIDKGQDSWTCIEHAIKTTPIAIVIFSENYAQSEWCLKELHVILKTHGVQVFPMFYKIEPWEVRFPERGRFSKGFAKLKGRHDVTVIDEWRVDLDKASKLNGWECKEGDKRLEKELVSEIVGRVFEWANKTLLLDIDEHVIGIDMVAYEIIQRLEQDNSVLVLGLWGMGGIGKSTLARELYNRLSKRFKSSTFVEGVTHKVMQDGIAKVQSRILKDLCKNESNEIEDKSRGKVVLEERLCEKKILVVLDDVCENDGMKYLISRKMLSKGSMCIVTSRNKRLIEKAESSDVASEVYVHDVQRLDYENSRHVFRAYAFGRGFKIDLELEELVSCITKACDGVPLVLKVCGALLRDEEDIEIWKDVLKKLQCGSMMDEEMIFECLRISYDALQAQQKEIFLDIACALLGQSKDLAIQIWRSQGWYGPLGVRSLVERALVTIDRNGCLIMHDHLRDMGRAIVKRKEVLDGVTRRLWEPESLNLFRDDEILLVKSLQTLVIFNDEMESTPTQLDLSCLKELRIMKCWLNSMTTLFLPKNLMWFFGWTKKTFPSIPQSSKLMILDLQGSKIKTLCESLGNAKNLEVLNLRGTGNLCSLPDSFGALASLRTLDLQGSGIKGLPESFGRLSSLKHLDMNGCANLKWLPDSFGALGKLGTLNLWRCGIEGLPESFGSLSSLEHLTMWKCSHLKGLPDSFGGLGTLWTLYLADTRIEGLPKTFGRLSSLEELNMDGCSHLKGLPDSIGDLGKLRTLNLRRSRIEGLPESFERLSSLKEDLDMHGCLHLKGLLESFGAFGTLRTIRLQMCGIEGLPESFGKLSSLVDLDMYGCSHLKGLPDSFGALGTLQTLILWNSGIEGLPESFGSLSSLEHLKMNACSNLKKLPNSFGDLGTLRTLHLQSSGIEGLPESFRRLSSLEDLDMYGCSHLKGLPCSFGALGTLRTLVLDKSDIEVLPESIGRLSSLKRLKMYACSKLKKLPNSFGDLGTLRTLDLEDSGIESLPKSFASLSSLELLDLSGCQNLTKLPDAFWDLRALMRVSFDGSGVDHWPVSFEKVCSREKLNSCHWY